MTEIHSQIVIRHGVWRSITDHPLAITSVQSDLQYLAFWTFTGSWTRTAREELDSKQTGVKLTMNVTRRIWWHSRRPPPIHHVKCFFHHNVLAFDSSVQEVLMIIQRLWVTANSTLNGFLILFFPYVVNRTIYLFTWQKSTCCTFAEILWRVDF
jgi:hypothetical protein